MAKPTATEIRDVLEGYGISDTVVTDSWLEGCRDEEIIPHVNEITRMDFEAEQTVTEYYNGNGKDLLILNRRPVNEIVTIQHVGGGGSFIGSIELIGAEGLVKAANSYSEGIYGPIFKKGTKNIKVTYKYGYTDYPTDVKRAIKNMVAAKALNLVGARTGGGSVTVQSHGRNYGNEGKYQDIRKELVHTAYYLLRKYETGVVGS